MSEKPTFEEIVRGLLVFLKGQIPALQIRTSPDEISRHLQNIVIYLRNSILQLESASSFDPKVTPEFKELQLAFENLKRANERFEESLFLEMEKNQKLTLELEELKKSIAIPKEEKEKLQKERVELNSEIISLKKTILALETELERKNSELKLREQEIIAKNRELLRQQQQSSEFTREQKEALEKELKKNVEDKQVLTALLEKYQKELKEVQQELEKLRGQIPFLKEKIAAQEETISLLKNSQEKKDRELEEAKQQIVSLRKELNDRDVILESNEKTILSLQETVAKLKRDLLATTAGEVIRNIQGSYEAKIAFLEKTLAETKQKLEEKEALLGQAPEKVENILREKLALEQRLIDLEAIVRRVSSVKLKQNEPADSIEFGAEECVFFFEFFSQIMSRLERNIEFNDLRYKADEALKILMKTHAIETIPTVGSVFMENLHKPVKAFYTPLLEDGTIIHEVSRGFRFKDYVIQRANVWITKSKFKCISCGTVARPHDSFCPKCGLEICAPDGTPKRRLAPMPTTLDICLPLADFFLKNGNLRKAQDLIDFVIREHPDDPECKRRKNLIAQKLQEMGEY